MSLNRCKHSWNGLGRGRSDASQNSRPGGAKSRFSSGPCGLCPQCGWERGEIYRVHSHVYAGHDRPEIIVPRTDHLGDYATVVSRLIGVFAQVADQDELTIYRSLVTGDRDVVRVRVADADDGSLELNQGVDLIGGARDLVLSAACSITRPRPKGLPCWREPGGEGPSGADAFGTD